LFTSLHVSKKTQVHAGAGVLKCRQSVPVNFFRERWDFLESLQAANSLVGAFIH
jgi:hypothetical protein